MKIGLFFGIACAFLLHAGVLLFGGLLFSAHGVDYASLQKVELLTDDAVEQKKKPEEPKEKQEIEDRKEEAPDAEKIIEKLELSAADNTPKLEAASLSAIEAALGGQAGAGGDFAGGMSFASGGRIGGTGKAGGDQDLDKAFSMSEIDQKPRVVFQSSPQYPSGMRSVQGSVTVIFIVDQAGRVGNPRVESSTNPGFEKAAIASVKQWKFEPAVRGGQRVSCKMRERIKFVPR